MHTDRDKRLLRDILQSNWSESYPERSVDVPQPEIVIESEEDRRSVHMRDQDVVFVMASSSNVEPASIGYRDEEIEVNLDLEIYTAAGPERFDGVKGDEYGGLIGEIRRIIHSVRRGVGRYDMVVFDEFEDETETYGADMWVARITVRFIAYTHEIPVESSYTQDQA